MHRQDLFSSSLVRPVDQDLAVETSGSQECWVEHLGPIGRAEQDKAARRIKTVQLGQELVQGLVLLVMSAADIRTAGTAERIELVDEDDRGRVLTRLLEQVPNSGGADADEHLDKLRARDRKERDACLPGHGAG